MGIFTNRDDGGEPVNKPDEVQAPEVDTTQEQPQPQKFKTDVEGVEADAEVAHGSDRFPMFNVDKNEFYQNMENGRKRLRFKSGSTVQQYMSKTKYQRPFYISYTDSSGKTYNRKIK